MPRDLNADERALWKRVTAEWRGEAVSVTVPAPVPAPAASPVIPSTAPPMVRTAAKRPPSPRSETLDARWDRQLKSGSVAPDRIVDLHGLTLASAHLRAVDAIADAVRRGERLVLIVTGKPPPSGSSRLDTPLRGVIRASLRDWLVASPVVDAVAAIRPAHMRHGGSGALYIVLRRARY